MEDQQADLDDHGVASTDKTANQSARAGGQAKGGIAAQSGDPTSPAEAAERAATLNDKMVKAGFGDHKGAQTGDNGNAAPAR